MHAREAKQRNSKQTHAAYVLRARELYTAFRKRPAEELGAEELRGYAEQRLRKGATAERVRKELLLLRAAMRWGVRRGHVGAEAAERVLRAAGPGRPGVVALKPAQLDAVLAELPAERRRWVVVAAYTGGSGAQLGALRWESIDWTGATLRLPAAGGRPARVVRMAPGLMAELGGCAASSGGRVLEPWLNRRRDLGAACERAKLRRGFPEEPSATYTLWLKAKGLKPPLVRQASEGRPKRGERGPEPGQFYAAMRRAVGGLA